MWRLFDQLLWLYSPVSQCPIVPFISRCCNSDQLIGSNYRLYMIEVVERLALVLLLLSSWSDNTLLRNQRGAHMVQELRPEVQVLWMTKGPPHLHHHHHHWAGIPHITLIIVNLFIFLMSPSMHFNPIIIVILNNAATATSKHYRGHRQDRHNQSLRRTHVRKSERMGDNLKEG